MKLEKKASNKYREHIGGALAISYTGRESSQANCRPFSLRISPTSLGEFALSDHRRSNRAI